MEEKEEITFINNSTKKQRYVRDKLSLDNQVVKSNKLIKARYRLSPLEQKLVLILCSKISSTDDYFMELSLTVNEFSEFADISNKDYELNRTIKKKCKELAEKGVHINAGTKEKPIYEWYPWFKRLRYTPSKSEINMIFNDALEPYLLSMQETYTKYRLRLCNEL